jgi:hypothetical protein
MGTAADITSDIVSDVRDIRSVPMSRLASVTQTTADHGLPEASVLGERVAVAAFTSSI